MKGSFSFRVYTFPLPWFMKTGKKSQFFAKKKQNVLLAGPTAEVLNWTQLVFQVSRAWNSLGFLGFLAPFRSVLFTVGLIHRGGLRASASARFVDGLVQHLYVFSLHRSWWRGLRWKRSVPLPFFFRQRLGAEKKWDHHEDPWDSTKIKIFPENWWLEADSFPFRMAPFLGDIRENSWGDSSETKGWFKLPWEV